MEARKASREAALRGKEVWEKTEDMAEPMPEKSPIASGALTPPRSRQFNKTAEARGREDAAIRSTEQKARQQKTGEGMSMRLGVEG